MPSTISDLELRLADLQAQLDRLSHKAHHSSVPVEERLAALADQYDAYLKRWALAIEWHARAVTQLESHVNEWKDAASRVQEDASDRLQRLETVVDREWTALRRIHEQPVTELRQQASSLTEVCIATASAAQQGFDRAEARLAAFESEFHRTMGELTREVHAALAEIRLRPTADLGLSPSGAPWSFDDVTRLHDQLRGSSGVSQPPGDHEPRGLSILERPRLSSVQGSAHSDAETTAPAAPPSSAGDESARVEHVPAPWQSWKPVIVSAVIAVAIVAAFGWYLRNQMRASTARVQQVETTARRAVADADRRADAARTDAAREISSARDVATRAQRIGEIMAAPDVIRYRLVSGSGGAGASGRASWSRSRGLLISASQVPPPPPGRAYHVWLLTRFGPVPAGTLTSKADGTATLVEEPRDIRRAVIGIAVTADAATADRPSEIVVLTSVQPSSEEPSASQE